MCWIPMMAAFAFAALSIRKRVWAAGLPRRNRELGMRIIPLALGAALLASCQVSTDQEDKASELIEFGLRNPPVSPRTWAGVSKLACTPTKLDVCDEAECRSVKVDANKPPFTVNWYPADAKFERCDKNGCDVHQAPVSYGGSFASINLPARDHIFRVTASGEYREIANLLNDTYVYRGKCIRE